MPLLQHEPQHPPALAPNRSTPVTAHRAQFSTDCSQLRRSSSPAWHRVERYRPPFDAAPHQFRAVRAAPTAVVDPEAQKLPRLVRPRGTQGRRAEPGTVGPRRQGSSPRPWRNYTRSSGPRSGSVPSSPRPVGSASWPCLCPADLEQSATIPMGQTPNTLPDPGIRQAQRHRVPRGRKLRTVTCFRRRP